MLLQTVIEVIY